jgi:hypothetical protein
MSIFQAILCEIMLKFRSFQAAPETPAAPPPSQMVAIFSGLRYFSFERTKPDMLIADSRRCASLLVLVTAPLLAQNARQHDPVPLKHWQAPLYWQPSPQEANALARPESMSADQVPNATVPTTPLVFVGITPCRLVDTRPSQAFPGAFGPPRLVGGASRTFPILSSTTCPIPASAQAYSFNVTVVPPGPLGFITVFPTGQPLPLAATLNSVQGFIVGNAATIPGGTNGAIDVYASDATDLVIDINGYYTPQSTTLAPGTAAAPSLSFTGDTGTGIFSSGTGALNIATGGVNRVTVRSDGDVDITGNLRKNGQLLLHNLGTTNTSVGIGALGPGNLGNANVAVGTNALAASTTGANNTALGAVALATNNTGFSNTGVGASALTNNTTGTGNTALGGSALANNTTSINNTAVGLNAMGGGGAVVAGSNNTAVGTGALATNSGSSNTVLGSGAMGLGTGPNSSNTAVGFQALQKSVTGDNNIALGTSAGSQLTSGANNIYIGNVGVASESGAIRLGASGTQTLAFIAGIRGVTTGVADAIAVVVDSNGQLGTVASSGRFKEDIHDMADASSGLLRLRPVTFRYKRPYEDGSKPVDYGLIAEEVAAVYPDLVVKGADGQAETVQYQKLIPMLLNELQKEHEQVEQQAATIRELQTRLTNLEGEPR